jgi:hypothetical protein
VINLNEPAQQTLSVKKRALISVNRELTGDEEIDKKLTIKTTSAALLRRLISTTRLRQGLLELGERARSKELSLSRKTLHYIELGQISDTEYIQAVLIYLIDLTSLVERFDRMAF